MRVLIGTNALPIKDLGGPGKFAPYFFSRISEIQDNRFEFIGLFGRYIVKDKEQIIYHKPEIKSKSYIRLINKLPHLSVFLRKYKKILKNRKLRSFVDKNVDLLHLHDFELVSSLSKVNKPIIFTNHFKGSLYKEFIKYLPNMNNPLYEKYFMNIEKSAIKRANIITFPSRSALNLLIEDFPTLREDILNKHKIIYTGIDDRFPENSGICFEDWRKKKKNIVLNIANHIPDKGIENAIHVFKYISQLDNDLVFVNIGSYGPETEKLKKLTQTLGLSSKVVFKGIVSHEDVMKYLSGAKYYIHTPNRVVFDLVLLEAMSSLTPIISSQAMGNIEALGKEYSLYINHKNELLFPLNLLKDERSLFRIARGLRERFLNHFTTTKMIENYVKLYEMFL